MPWNELIPLRGADDPAHYSGHDQQGNKLDPRACVVPIFSYDESALADHRFLGTGFFIASGIVATARHVVEAFSRDRFHAVLQMDGPTQVSPRRIHSASLSRNSDVAIVRVVQERPGQTNPSVILNGRKPAPGSAAYTLACANSRVHDEPSGKQSVAINYEYFRGNVVEQFPLGRDRVMLPWPCYQVDYHLHAGASGGPTFDASGAVFAINCSSHEPQTNVAYVTSIDMILGCEIPNISIDGKHYPVGTIMDLVNAGIVRYELP